MCKDGGRRDYNLKYAEIKIERLNHSSTFCENVRKPMTNVDKAAKLCYDWKIYDEKAKRRAGIHTQQKSKITLTVLFLLLLLK